MDDGRGGDGGGRSGSGSGRQRSRGHGAGSRERHGGGDGGGRRGRRTAVHAVPDGVHRARVGHAELRHRVRQHHGDGVVQDRQAAAEHQQLLPVQPGAGRLLHRPHIHAAVHRVHHTRLLAVRPARVRRLAGARLPGQQRVRAQPVADQLRPVPVRHPAAHVPGQADQGQSAAVHM